MRAAAKTDKGLIRPLNEDAFALECRPGMAFIAVADGMGGYNAGEVASSMAAKTLYDALTVSPDADPEALIAAFRNANLQIRDAAEAEQDYNGMGTTMTAVYCINGKAHVAHVGDSRAYLMRGGCLTQETNDHSLVEEMVRAGLLTKEQAAVHPQRNVITRALGVMLTVEVDHAEYDLMPGDKWLICSDGLYRHVADDEIAEALSRDAEPAETAAYLVSLAVSRGGTDNITCAILDNGEVAE